MVTPNDSLTIAFEDLLNSANNGDEFVGYLLNPPTSLTPDKQPSHSTPKIENDISGFCSQKYEWTSSQEGSHNCCKCIKEHLIRINDTKDIITTGNNFHFCGLDENVKCNSLTKIDTYISNAVKKRRSHKENCDTKNKANPRLKVNMDLWKPAKLEIRLQDIYCSDVMLKYIEPKLRYERGTLVWAKMLGYPTWPAMVDNDPDYNTYYWVANKAPQMVQYHVVFFDEDHFASRCWSPEDRLTLFTFSPSVSFKSIAMYKRFQVGFQHAKKALRMSIQERIEEYGFAAKIKQPGVILVEN